MARTHARLGLALLVAPLVLLLLGVGLLAHQPAAAPRLAALWPLRTAQPARHSGAAVHTFTLASSHVHELGGRRSASFNASAAPLAALAALPQRPEPLTLRSYRADITRPRNARAHTAARLAAAAHVPELEWETLSMPHPNISDRHTLRTLARMAEIAYYAPNDTSLPHGGWVPDAGWNISQSFGWADDGMRGHVFIDPKADPHGKDIVVLAIKGTSASVLPGGGDTAKRDKVNDNLLFSCCCAHVGWTWRSVCDCFGSSDPPPSHTTDVPEPTDGPWGASAARKRAQVAWGADPKAPTCSKPCLSTALVQKSLYYPAATDLFNNVSYAFPDADIWITGHSLGGAIASLLGHTFGVPVVTFEAPAERMAAQRLHLPMLSKHASSEHITNVYHSGDPIPMGECVGAASWCATAGFAMESRCHTGRTVLYDTTRLLGWSSNILTHRIANLIDDLFATDWDELVRGRQKDKNPPPILDDELEKLKAVPKTISEKKCTDCTGWKFTDDEPDSMRPSRTRLGLHEDDF